MTADVVVVGIGADGWSGLSQDAQTELRRARTVYGSTRQLDLLPADVDAARVTWRRPMSEHLSELASSSGFDHPIHILASGDPMFHGVGASLTRAFGTDRMRVFGHPSSVSSAAARLGWDLARADVVSLVTAPVDTLSRRLTDGATILILSRDATTPLDVADLLTANGFGESHLTVLSDVDGSAERVDSGLASTWTGAPSSLNIIGIRCVGPSRSLVPGLDDDEFVNDGQLTKRPIRALTVSALRPAERATLWDIGAGAGSVGVEWLRATATGRAIAFESDPARAANVATNARRHGVADRLTVLGAAPDALADAPTPDTVFVGGGMTSDVLHVAWHALPTGGRIVANAVTLETERLLVDAATRWGGELMRVSVERATGLGGSTAWRAAFPIVQWTAIRHGDDVDERGPR